MYDILSYAFMIAFEQRTSAYARALEARISPGAVVLDIGCGPGILSFIACRAGAARVYAVETDDVIQLARDSAADNGFADRIEFIQGLTTEIDLPEKVDVIVTDIHGILPLERKSVVSILDARDRFLKPGGWIIPSSETIWTALTCCPEFYGSLVDAWNTKYELNFVKASERCINSFHGARLTAQDLIVPAQRWTTLDYAQLHDLNVSAKSSWVIADNAIAHGFSTWYDCETADGVSFSNSPATVGPHVYRHAFFPWPQAVELRKDDRVEVTLRADYVDTDYIWSWNTRITGAAEQEKARFSQSTFKAAAVSLERLRKRGNSFVPTPSEDCLIDRRVLEMIERRQSLDEIAEVLMKEFPTRMPDHNAALSRAADLSEKYSR